MKRWDKVKQPIRKDFDVEVVHDDKSVKVSRWVRTATLQNQPPTKLTTPT